MLTFKCKNCGAEMSVDPSGSLFCEYCGTRSAFSDRELLEYRDYRKRMLEYLRSSRDVRENKDSKDDFLWSMAETEHFHTVQGQEIRVRYIYNSEEAGIRMYLAREAVLYHYSGERIGDARKAVSMVRDLQYPEADVRNLKGCVPDYLMQYELDDGSVLLPVRREQDVFPLAMFSCLDPRDVAWIISRMENVCCLLEYSEMGHGGIDTENFFINPFTHQGMLLGGWYLAGRKSVKDDLKAIRTTAGKLLGMHPEGMNEPFEKFLAEEPADSAFDDFARWDQVIETGFGGRRFHEMEVKL